MVCHVVQTNQLKSAGGNSGASSYCMATLAGSFIGDNMKKIPLTQDKFALVDDEDFDRINARNWHLSNRHPNYYARSSALKGDNKGKCLMHRMILGLSKGDKTMVDHINHNGLDNRKENLRLCTRTQNLRNMRTTHGKSKYKGAFQTRNPKKWASAIRVDGTLIHIGHFETEIEAAKAYDAKARIYFGEFANTNFERE